jgi:hypothetical protein
MPHDIHRVIGFEDLILAQDVPTWDEHVRCPGFLLGFFDRWHHFVVNLHNCTPVVHEHAYPDRIERTVGL